MHNQIQKMPPPNAIYVNNIKNMERNYSSENVNSLPYKRNLSEKWDEILTKKERKKYGKKIRNKEIE